MEVLAAAHAIDELWTRDDGGRRTYPNAKSNMLRDPTGGSERELLLSQAARDGAQGCRWSKHECARLLTAGLYGAGFSLWKTGNLHAAWVEFCGGEQQRG